MLCVALPPTTAIATCCRTDSAPQCIACMNRVAQCLHIHSRYTPQQLLCQVVYKCWAVKVHTCIVASY